MTRSKKGPPHSEAAQPGHGSRAPICRLRVEPNKRRAIREGLEEVREALERLAAAQAETLAARLERKRVLREFNEDFVHLAGLVESLCGLAGYEEWKKLVQASRQEKGLLVSVLRRRRAARAERGEATDP